MCTYANTNTFRETYILKKIFRLMGMHGSKAIFLLFVI